MIRRALALSISFILLGGLLASGYERSEFLFLDEIEVGMTGIGRTVVAGDRISEFAVEILGILDQPGTFTDFIAVRVSGEAIGRTGGIAQGMSGSPIYIDGKLIGALSRAASWSKELTPIGLVTPIEPMLDVLGEAAAAGALAAASQDAVLRDVRLIELDSAPTADLVAAAPRTIFSHPVSTPIVTHGLSERARGILMDGLAAGETTELLLLDDVLEIDVGPGGRGLSSFGLSLLPVSGTTGAGAIDPASLEPGSSVGVALATGDLAIGSLGTLTYRDDETLVAYGHRFINNGSSRFAMTTVSIVDTIKAYDASFKLGTLGQTIGTIFEDRYAAIGGRIGTPFDGIDLELDVLDRDSDHQASFSVELADEPRLMTELLLSTGFDAIDTTLDRIGQGTVTVTYTIDGPGMPSPLERRDTFFSGSDIAVYPPLQLANIVGALQYNAYADPQITSISTSMELTSEIRGIWINNLQIDRFTYGYGETIRFRLSLQTYQGETLTREGEITVPPDLFSERILLRAYGGPRYLESGETAEVFENLGDMIEAIERLPSYETLTVELFAVDPFSTESDALFGVDEVEFEFPDHVVYGERQVNALLISSSNESEEGVEPDW